MPIFSLIVYQDSSFASGTVPNEANFSAPDFSITTSSNQSFIVIQVDDNDATSVRGSDSTFDEAGAAGGSAPDQVLVQSVTINGTLYPAGTVVAVEYAVEDDDGNLAYGISFGKAGNNLSNDVQALATVQLLENNTTYNYSADGVDNFAQQVEYSDFVPCFVQGTEIRIVDKDGQISEVSVNDVAVGDLVITNDQRAEPVRWIGSSSVSAAQIIVNDKLRPVRIAANALGDGYPSKDLLVSRQHRILVRSAVAERIFNEREVLIPAIKLVGIDGVEIAQAVEDVEYFHILFDQHEIICSNGAWSESLFTGQMALKSLSPKAREEIKTLFPEICAPGFTPTPAKHIPKRGILMKRLSERHQKNRVPVYSS